MTGAVRQVCLVALASTLVGACTMMPAEEDPTLLRLQSLERRLEAIERILANGSLVELTLQVDELQRRSAELQGRVEQVEYEGEGAGERQRALYADLDDRLQSLETRLGQVVAGVAAAASASADGDDDLPVPGGTDQQNYQAAFELLKEQRYEQAATAFAQFLTTYPDSQLADNAQYWLAESYYVLDEFERARTEFRAVLDRYPRSRKVPDALLKIGYCYYELEDWPAARVALSEVQADHPDTTAARLADQRLKRMADEGH